MKKYLILLLLCTTHTFVYAEQVDTDADRDAENIPVQKIQNLFGISYDNLKHFTKKTPY